MINTDGKLTIANAGAEKFVRDALEAGGHLADDVAAAALREEREQQRKDSLAYFAEVLASDEEALD